MDFTKFENQIFFTTVRITIPSKDGRTSSIGTGFLVNVPLRHEGRMAHFLVSNKHVYGDPQRKIILNFHEKSSDKDAPNLGKTKSVEIEDFSAHYYGHPNNKIDLACINVSAYIGEHSGVYSKHLHSEFFDEANLESLLPGSDVSFIGYPDNRFDTIHNLPILRKGYVATLPTVDFNGLKQIVIDAHVFPGSSGSPVFVISNGHYKLLGVVTETMIKNEELRTIQADFKYGIQQTIGLGIVLKTELVMELLDFAKEGLSNRIEASSTQTTNESNCQ